MENIPASSRNETESQEMPVRSLSKYPSDIVVSLEGFYSPRTSRKNLPEDVDTHECLSEKDSVSEIENKKPARVKKKRKVSLKKSSKIYCEICSRHFRDNYNFRRHFETKHGKTYACDLCSTIYNTEKKLLRHMKKHTSSVGSDVGGIKCLTCSRVFRDKYNLQVHSCSRHCKKFSCIFPDCNKQFYHVTRMLKHVDEDHNGKIDTVNLTFESEDLFQHWKEEEELKSYTFYSKRSGTVDSFYGSYRCYVCQADGKSVVSPRKTTKRWKKGHVKLGALCPSRMFVKEIGGKIHVKYITYHSHPRSVKNDKLPVPKSVKTYAKNLLLMGASPQQVRKRICEGSSSDDSIIPKGGYVISNRYFSDMKKRLDTHQFPVTDEKYDPVFVYKPEGQPVIVGDEALDRLAHSNSLYAIGLQTKEQWVMMKKRAHVIVCVALANTYSMCGFEILTLIVPDVFGNGYPVAYILTSHLDEETLIFLFQCLKTRCSKVKIKYVMTENSFTVFSAFNAVFGNLKHFLCQTHTKKCWENEIVKNHEFVEKDLIKSLEGLLYESSEDSFKKLSKEFIEQYHDCKPEFVKYFVSNFLSCPEVWAMCYRNSSPKFLNPVPYTNVTLYCEYVQNRLKTTITSSITSLSVPDLALLILRIQESHCLLYKSHLQSGTRVRSPAKGKHFCGLAIRDCNVSSSFGKWLVKSQYDNSVVYTVNELMKVCKQPTCYVQCSEASCQNLCNHLYNCSCDDSFSLCEHIHKVHSQMLQPKKFSCPVLSPKKKHQNKPSDLELRETMRHRNLVVMAEIFPSADMNEIEYKTDVNREIDCITNIDVDFVSISISENSEQAEVLERLYESQEKIPLSSGIDTHMKGVDILKHRKARVCSNKKLRSDKKLHSGTNATQQYRNLVNNRMDSDSKINCNLNPSEPIKLEKLENTEVDVPFIKASNSCVEIEDAEKEIGSSTLKRKLAEEESQIKLRRSKRPLCVSVIQGAVEYKRRCLESFENNSNENIKIEDTADDMLLSGKVRPRNLECKFCKEIFTDSYNLEKHIANNHSKPFLCSVCAAVFKTRVRYENHVKSHVVKKSRQGSVQCNKCMRTFRDNYNMKLHRCEVARKQSLCIFPDCNKQFYHMKQMVRHLEGDHHNKIDCTDFHFDSEKLFFAWKEEEETRTVAVFNKRNGTLSSDSIRYSYYVCQAGGESNVTGTTSKRKKCKVRTGKACPSRMLVREENGKFRVKYIAFHSHDIKEDYKMYPPLPKYVKELGKQLLLMGMSPKRVRERIQDGVILNNRKGTQKRYAVKRRYFYDMKKRLEKKGFVFQSESNDQNEYSKPKDFAELINGGKHKSYDPLLIYKPQGQSIPNEDEELASQPFYSKLFALGFQTKDQNDIMKEEISKVLCIRSYFEIKTDGFQLLNFSVPDKFGNGYPVAHFIVNFVNEFTLIFLFRSLKKRCPNLKVHTLITDDDMVIYNAMQSVFGPIRHYACHWHVKSCWQEKIEQLVSSEDHKVDIPFHLMNILYEKDQSKFQMLCRNFGDVYSSTCLEFMKYFLDFYLEKPEVWAMCYRQISDGITYSEPFSHVNLHSEYLDDQLNSLNFSGKFSQRVGELTRLLLKVEKEYIALYKRDTHYVPIYCSASGRHFSGLKIEDINVLNEGNNWIVLSRFDKSVKHCVTLLERSCNRVNCFEKCLEFLCVGLCSHLYICSCGDRADLCEHIHKVHSMRQRNSKQSDVETLTGEKMSSIHVIINEEMDSESCPRNTGSLRIELDSFQTIDSYDDSIVYHEICECDV